MPRILGVDIPKEKRIEISLTYLYGIGRALSNKLLKEINIDPSKRAKDLSEEEVSRITNTLQKSFRRIGQERQFKKTIFIKKEGVFVF